MLKSGAMLFLNNPRKVALLVNLLLIALALSGCGDATPDLWPSTWHVWQQQHPDLGNGRPGEDPI